MTGDEERMARVLQYLEAVDTTHAIRLAHLELGPAIPQRPDGPDRRRPLPQRRGAVQEPAAATEGSDEPPATPAGPTEEISTVRGDDRRLSLIAQLDERTDGYINFDLTEAERCDAALARDLLRLDGAESVGSGAARLDDWPAAREFVARVLHRYDITP